MVKVTVRDHLTGEVNTYYGAEGDRMKAKLDAFLVKGMGKGKGLCVPCFLEGMNEPAVRVARKPSGGSERGVCEKHYMEENK